MSAFLIFVFIVGLCIGSFLNVLLSRLPADRHGIGLGRGILFGRSRCPHCRHALAWYDLVPVFSFVLLKGRCRMCRRSISPRYPVIELSTAVITTFLFARMGAVLSPEFLLSAVLLVGLLALFFFDILYLLLPDVIMIPLVILALTQGMLFESVGLRDALGTGFLLAAGFGILYVVSCGRWIGFGDVKFALLVGISFGYPLGIAVVVVSVWAATLFGLGLLALRRATLATALPFGAFLAGVAIISLIFKHEAKILVSPFL